MATQDPQALWVMQGWSFVFDPFWTKDRIKAYLRYLPTIDMPIRPPTQHACIADGWLHMGAPTTQRRG